MSPLHCHAKSPSVRNEKSCDIDLNEVLAVPSKRRAISFQAKAVLLLYPWSRCTTMRKSQADAKAFRLVDSSIAQDGTKTKLC